MISRILENTRAANPEIREKSQSLKEGKTMKKVNSYRIVLSILAVMFVMTLVPSRKAFSSTSISEATVIVGSVEQGEWKYYDTYSHKANQIIVELQDIYL